MSEPTRRLIPLREVQQLVSFSRSTIYEKVRKAEFPAPVKISENRVAWDSAVIAAWIDTKLQAAA